MIDRASILALLDAHESASRRALAVLIVDHLLARPVADWVDVESLAPILLRALDEANMARALERHVAPGIRRVRAAAGAADERIGSAVPDASRAELLALLTSPHGPRFGWLRGALDPERLRRLLAPAFQELLLQFAGKLSLGGLTGGAPGQGQGPTAGLVGRLGRRVSKSTERLVNVGRSMADGLGVDLEARFKEVARDFSQGAVGGLQQALAARLRSTEGQALLGELTAGALDHILATPIETVLADLDRLPLERALALVPPITAGVLARELGRSCLEGELRAWLELEGQRSLAELLDEAGIGEEARALAVERADAAARELVTSEAFREWLDELLSKAQATPPEPAS